MMKNYITITFLLFFCISFSQDKNLKEAINLIETHEYIGANNKLNEFKKEFLEGVQSEKNKKDLLTGENLSIYYFLHTKLSFEETPFQNIDNAYSSVY